MSGPGSEQEQELVTQFADVTGANTERARFFMEASGWNLQIALASFFEGEQSDHEDDSTPPPTAEDAPGLLSQITNRGIQSQPKPPAPPKAKPVPRSGLATLDSLRQQEENESSDEDEEAQAFFAGGSVTSGQQVLGPPKKKDEFIKELFEKAREHGATAEEPSAPRSRPAASFVGTGYTLGDSTSASSAQPTGSSSSSRLAEPEPQEVTLRLWSTGFTIDDGELRLYNDQNNVEFLNSIKRGEIPRELIRSHHGREVQLAMEDHRMEAYTPPKVARNPFSGQGHVLGSPAPTVVTSTAKLTETDQSKNEEAARSQINLAESEPVTNIRFQLADGTRLVARFNHTHRISDLHSFINAARPQFTSTNYILTLFPNRELTDMEATVKDANILNAALTQKIKPTA